jgi:hypothetical protein
VKRRPRQPRDVTTGRTADVSIDMGGIAVRVDGVPLADAGDVALYLLALRRTLIAQGADELVPRVEHVGGDRVEVPDEDGVAEWHDLPTLTPPRRVGF